MHPKRILTLVIFSWLAFHGSAQVAESIGDIDRHSLALYNAAQWKQLVAYGKEKIIAGNSFPLLRMRTGYAAYRLGNYSESLLQYSKVLHDDPSNAIALYYVYLNNLYLNNIPAARYYAGKLPDETRASEKISKIKLSSLQAEFSHNMPSDVVRKDAEYARLGLNLQLGYRLELQQSVALYNQVINEPALTLVRNNNHISIDEREYYGKLLFGLSGKVSLLGGVHLINTPYNNIVYNNTVGFGGVKFTTPYVHLQTMANFAQFSNVTYNQYDAVVSLYPLGNLKFYSITQLSAGEQANLREVIGYEILKKIWLEGNVTAGAFNNFLENDALYYYNDIDRKILKAGGSVYASLSNKLLLTLSYTYERKLRYQTTGTYYYQNAINGGLTWNF
jgi:hypothetical protein